MWYKDEGNGSHSYATDSEDLYKWKVVGPMMVDRNHEGPNVFYWRGKYWMVGDQWQGLLVYSSPDAEHWTFQKEPILETPGTRSEDGAKGQHADVLVQGDDAYIIYFTHPQLNENVRQRIPGVTPYEHRRTSLQVAMLDIVDGKLVCDRNKPFNFVIEPPKE